MWDLLGGPGDGNLQLCLLRWVRSLGWRRSKLISAAPISRPVGGNNGGQAFNAASSPPAASCRRPSQRRRSRGLRTHVGYEQKPHTQAAHRRECLIKTYRLKGNLTGTDRKFTVARRGMGRSLD